MSLIFIVIGLILLYYGAEWLIKGSSSVAFLLGIKPLIIGLTIVAFGTSSPELLVSIQAALDGVSDMAIGNVIGSNICNIGLILGISALIKPIKIKKEIFQFDLPILLTISFLLIWPMSTGVITFLNGALLVSLLVLYLLLAYWRSKRQQLAVVGEVQDLNKKATKSFLKNGIAIIAGLIGLVAGAWFLVEGAIELATILGMSTAVIGLTIVAFGTSVPELAASAMASWKGNSDFVVGGVIGSNVFNILCILGITALILPLQTGGITNIDVIVMLAFTLIIIPFMRTGYRISRIEGAVLVLGYFAYMVFLVQ